MEVFKRYYLALIAGILGVIKPTMNYFEHPEYSASLGSIILTNFVCWSVCALLILFLFYFLFPKHHN